MWVDDSKHFVYPRLFSIHDMDANAVPRSDTPGQRYGWWCCNRIQLPAVVNLSVDRLTSNGVFLLDNGVEMVGYLFGVHSLDEIDPQQVRFKKV